MMRNPLLPFLILVGAYTALFFSIVFGSYQHIQNTTRPDQGSELFYIEPGSGLLRIAHTMANKNYAQKPWHVMLVAKVKGYERRLQAGEYQFAPGLNLAAKLDQVAAGKVYLRRVIIPEGLSAVHVDAILQNTYGLSMQGYLTPKEGSLLPDTYFFERGESAKALTLRMQASMQRTLDTAWETRGYDLPIKTKEEALILASIVEKETAVATERGLVAAVFVNRLRKGMRLQSDPTTIYGITGGLPLGRGLKRSELKAETPYNTYRIKGLPPTPIANPGIDSIKAVLNPADVDYLYFVADGSGGHAFASTLEDHNKNVAHWRRIQ